MANVNRHRKDDLHGERVLAVDSATVIEVGDLCFYDTDDVKPASSFTYASSLAITHGNFANNFCGVAMQASASGETDAITVWSRGVFEFVCAAAQFQFGDFVAPDDNASGNALLDQQVIETANDDDAIGRVTKAYTSNTTSVQCVIDSIYNQVDHIT